MRSSPVRRSALAGGVALGLVLAGTIVAKALPITFAGSGTAAGNSVSAQADFSKSGDQLTIVLSNTSLANALEVPGSTLTGLTFKIGGSSPALTPVSASASSIFNSAACDVGSCAGSPVNIGGEFGYQQNYGGAEAIASAGYLTTGLAHNLGNFGGSNLDDPKSLDGINFGIVSSVHGPFNGGNGGLANEPLVLASATFVLNGFLSYQQTDISDVRFLYGTSPEASVGGSCINCAPPPGIPEPASLFLLGTGLAALAVNRRRRRP